ncbi:hypothetical protein [Pseudomonas syringae]|uniref:hypothetical protein n=1 Tax=Pseudomonas syringae TaxID=317 RepID=UPI001F156168|nr:hypothetical protein [Pseudomonas syringae]UZS64496.1 hypothetical protein OQB64_10150 [Pseudomonas syringae]
MLLTVKELLERDAKRNIGEGLLAAIRDVKAARHGDVYDVKNLGRRNSSQDGFVST